MRPGDTADLFVIGNRRTGIDRREFNYTLYIPERRLRRERRRFAVVNKLDVPKAFKEEGVAFFEFSEKHEAFGRKAKGRAPLVDPD